MKSYEVRTKFIDFFKSKGHVYAAPSPVIQTNDPTLLFTNAGMNQFKSIFLGETRPEFRRAVNSQVCIRISGKHNDLEEVGKDFTHLTLFEMLGNWSFGDYYKKEAIVWAWQFLTEILHLPKEKLYATVFYQDNESLTYWQELTDINRDHIKKFYEKDNFWEMADVGPCGPCSEIHVDLGESACQKKNLPHTCEVNGDCGRFIELWNLVFIAYNRNADGSLTDLPETHVDTGAGLERITAFLQNTNSNYDTDLFKPIIHKIELLTGVEYQSNLDGMPHRVIADHIRTLTFAIADNVFPSNEGRGYVLRRLLRRALRYLKKLNVNKPMLYQLVDTVVEIMGMYYEHLNERKDLIKNIIQKEEENFLRTLDSGLKLFYDLAEKAENKVILGKDAFKLYDTYGFPIDLTTILAEENGLTVNLTDFDHELAKQKSRSREHIKLKATADELKALGGEVKVPADDIERLLLARHHTATHLLQAALRKFLGPHVHQAGSLVDTDYLRFDFSHFSKIDPEILNKIEEDVNGFITARIPVEFLTMTLPEAKKIGAMALFGEKYGDTVRVVKINDISLELCGGNHVKNTGDIESVKIVSESAIAQGVRRIVALAGTQNITNHLQMKKQQELDFISNKLTQLEKIIKEILAKNEVINFDFHIHKEHLKFSDLEILSYFELNRLASFEIKEIVDLKQHLLSLIKAAEKKLAEIKNKSAQIDIPSILETVQEIEPNIFVLVRNFSNIELNQLKMISDALANANHNLIMVLCAASEEKASCLIKISAYVLDRIKFNALDLVKEMNILTAGKGGGRPDLATMGNLKVTEISAALEKIKIIIKEKLNASLSN